jgi:hypothetical protein
MHCSYTSVKRSMFPMLNVELYQLYRVTEPRARMGALQNRKILSMPRFKPQFHYTVNIHELRCTWIKQHCPATQFISPTKCTILIIQGNQKVSVHLIITVQKKHAKYFKHFQSLTTIKWLELGVTDGVSVSLVSPWPWRSAAILWTLLVTFSILIIRSTDFLIALYLSKSS